MVTSKVVDACSFLNLPWLDGEDIREWPLIQRKKMLRMVARPISESLFNGWDNALLFRDLATPEIPDGYASACTASGTRFQDGW